jgi:hypothetical protein
MRAYRSPLKLFVFGIIGIVLIAAAVDITFGHWISTPPDNTDGVLTTRGHAQQRGDLLLGGAMLVTGILLFGGSVTELVRSKPTVAVNAEGLVVDSGGSSELIPWANIVDVSSGVVPDPYDGSMREQLIVEMTTDAPSEDFDHALPHVGDTIYIDAHDWASHVTELALSAQGVHDHYRRVEALRTYEPPSMVWEATIDQPDPEVSSAIDVDVGTPEDVGTTEDVGQPEEDDE